MDGLISFNNIISLPANATIPALDRGFLYSDQIFEVLVSFKHKILDLAPHLERLRNSADEFDIKIPWSNQELQFELQHLTEQIKSSKTNLRLVVTRGSGMGLQIPSEPKPNKIIYAFPAKIEDPDIYKSGIALKRKRLSFVDRGAHPKTSNYLRSIVGIRDAKIEGYDDIVWSNAEGEITEASTANIFLIGRLGDQVEICTPATNSGILAGITRSTIIRLLTNAGIRVTEGVVYAEELPRFDEAFVCSTVRGLVPVNRIDRHVLHSCRETSVFRKIESLFLTWIQAQLGHRIDWNTGNPV